MADAERSSGHRNDVLPLRPDGKTRYPSYEAYMLAIAPEVLDFQEDCIMTGKLARGQIIQKTSTTRR